MNRLASTLSAGDVCLLRDTRVTILRDSEPCSDRFGSDLFRFWSRREDTGEEGWITFGPTGMVRS